MPAHTIIERSQRLIVPSRRKQERRIGRDLEWISPQLEKILVHRSPYLSSEVAQCRAGQNGYHHEAGRGPNQPAISSLGSCLCIRGDVRNLRKHWDLNQFLQCLLVMNAVIQQLFPGSSPDTYE